MGMGRMAYDLVFVLRAAKWVSLDVPVQTKCSVGSRSERVDVPVHITGIYVTYSMFRGGYT